MFLLAELSAVVWVLVSLTLSIWVFNDAWLLSHTRAWAVAVFIFFPLSFTLYLYWSRWRRTITGEYRKPEYEVNTAVFAASSATGPVRASTTARKEGAEQKGDRSTADKGGYSQSLPRCPRCATAVSFYDVRCIKCGQQLQGMPSGQSF
ncbi:MAG: hypothetical protein KIY12_06530 [Thermoplasmata archaeon]|uniref:Uncharacterized protein n=1 Tax=Candidatus Sysuiplasma superficiale TaxID=2823368 RepID=A0A8J7YUH4_9ARCH|nr:hypothetical protein [Candidatus Sysuiplasma superficiale]MBX8644357.1 hypothetical protein [Candidatus Sysuiplasma superficiale]MCL4346997.1 hypothetical protein [Candidatus Thermoplasmatota archaeon]